VHNAFLPVFHLKSPIVSEEERLLSTRFAYKGMAGNASSMAVSDMSGFIWPIGAFDKALCPHGYNHPPCGEAWARKVAVMS